MNNPRDMNEGADARQASAFFGRRKGKQLRSHQADLMQKQLPQMTVDLAVAAHNPANVFPRPVDEVQLEIGFGGAEHLIQQAASHPEIGFIGCEAFINGVAKALARIEERGLDNVRIHPADALELLRILPTASIAKLFLLYPDPWPKPRQRKRRIVSEEFLDLVARALKPGAEFRFATDIDDYAAWTLSRVLTHPQFSWTPASAEDWTKPWAGWTSTRYEAKALREGRVPAYFTFHRL
jgi:tRNA (guanine-N7-)-methyltransferase